MSGLTYLPAEIAHRRTDLVDTQPLSGLVIADFARILAGPLVTQNLADLGARVIKIERPGTGHNSKHRF